MEQYEFDNDDNLKPQRIRKCDLAFFYGKTPQSFRKEIANWVSISRYSRYYSKNEVEKIFKYFGSVPSKFDVEKAKERIKNFHDEIKFYQIKKISTNG